METRSLADAGRVAISRQTLQLLLCRVILRSFAQEKDILIRYVLVSGLK